MQEGLAGKMRDESTYEYETYNTHTQIYVSVMNLEGIYLPSCLSR